MRQGLIQKEYFPRVFGFPRVRDLFDFLLGRGITVALGCSAKTHDLQVYKTAAGIKDLEMIETASEDAIDDPDAVALTPVAPGRFGSMDAFDE